MRENFMNIQYGLRSSCVINGDLPCTLHTKILELQLLFYHILQVRNLILLEIMSLTDIQEDLEENGTTI